MAILEGAPGIKAIICSDGDQKEYPDDGDWVLNDHVLPQPEFRASNYVQVVDEAEFLIKIEISPTYRANSCLSFIAEVDGTAVCMLKARHYDMLGRMWSGHLSSFVRRIGPTDVVTRPLRFSAITRVENVNSAQVTTDAELMAGVGEILVYVHRTTLGAFKPDIHPNQDPKVLKEVSEKALKGQAISHSVAYGAKKHIPRPRSPAEVFLDGQRSPMGVFRFKYRSKKALQLELIIPRSPSPDTPPFANRSHNDINTALSRNARLAQLENEIAKIKSEGGDARRIPKKRESDIQSGRALKTTRRRDGSVLVDLTDD